MTEVYFSKTWSILGYHDTLRRLKPSFPTITALIYKEVNMQINIIAHCKIYVSGTYNVLDMRPSY